jgi:hypothetical protein
MQLQTMLLLFAKKVLHYNFRNKIKYKLYVAWSATVKEKFCVLISLIPIIWFAYSYSYFEALREIFYQPKGTNPLHSLSLSIYATSSCNISSLSVSMDIDSDKPS